MSDVAIANGLFQSDAETSLLSILLQKPEKVYELHGAKPYMFSSTAHQALLSTVLELSQQGLIPEVNLIESYLKSKGKDQQVGGREYLNFLLRQSPKEENLLEYERLVINSFKAKSLITLTSKIPQSITTSHADVEGVISSLRSSLDSLSTESGGDSTSFIGSLLRESWEEIKNRVKDPGIQGVSTGWKQVDLSTSGLCGGNLWIISGRPGMGKSAVMCNLILNQAMLGTPVLVFSFEMRKISLVERFISIISGIDITNIRLGLLNQAQLDKITKAIVVIKDLPIYIDANFTQSNIEHVISTIRKYQKTTNIKSVFIDYVQLLSSRGEDDTKELGRISRACKIIANDLDIGVVLLSQLSREVERRDDKHPILSDLRQSGNLEEDADLVVGLYREIIYNPKTAHPKRMEFIILKQRQGATGTIVLSFNSPTNAIIEE